jgi:polyhydroxyalkanoate synthesis regulator phasin
MADASAVLMKLRPVTFRYKQPYDDGGKPIQYGLIAEEVAEVLPDLAVFNKDGAPEAVKYHVLPALLLNEYQGQQKTIERQEKTIQSQAEQIAAHTEQAQQQQAINQAQQEQIAALERRLISLEARLAPAQHATARTD